MESAEVAPKGHVLEPAELAPKGHVLESAEMKPKDHVLESAEMAPKDHVLESAELPGPEQARSLLVSVMLGLLWFRSARLRQIQTRRVFW